MDTICERCGKLFIRKFGNFREGDNLCPECEEEEYAAYKESIKRQESHCHCNKPATHKIYDGFAVCDDCFEEIKAHLGYE